MSDKPALDIESAEEAANSIRPSWDTGEDADPAPPSATLIDIIPPQVQAGPTIIVGTPIVPLGTGNVNETAPFRAIPAQAAPATSPNPTTTKLGLSPEAAAVVAAANAAKPGSTTARLGPPPAPQKLDSASVIETIPSGGAKRESFSNAPTLPSEKKVSAKKVDPNAVTSPSAGSAAKSKAPPAAVAADPFRSTEPSDPDLDLSFAKKKSPKAVVFGAIGVIVVAVGIIGWKVSSSSEPAPKPAASTATGPVITSPTNDIPPPPPKEEAEPAAAKAAAPAPAPEPSPQPAAKAPDPTPSPPARAPEAPHPVAAAPAPAPKPKAAAPAPGPVPKTPQKGPGGGIVRDSPF